MKQLAATIRENRGNIVVFLTGVALATLVGLYIYDLGQERVMIAAALLVLGVETSRIAVQQAAQDNREGGRAA